MATEAKSNKTGSEMSRGSFRVLVAFRLCLDIRDSGVCKKAELAVLMALALRCNPEKAFSCFPSIAQICEDTRLGERTVKEAIKKLRTLSPCLLKVRTRANSSNTFFIQNETIARLAYEQRETKKHAEERELERYTDQSWNAQSVDHATQMPQPEEEDVEATEQTKCDIVDPINEEDFEFDYDALRSKK